MAKRQTGKLAKATVARRKRPRLHISVLVLDLDPLNVLRHERRFPAPRGLRPSQFYSYLTQMYGAPLGEPVAAANVIVFPYNGPEKGTRVVRAAAPMVMHPGTGEMEELRSRIERDAEFAHEIGVAPSEGIFAGRDPWRAPFYDHQALLNWVNDEASRAMRESQIGPGLAHHLERLRLTEGKPGWPFINTAPALDAQERAARDAASRADEAAGLRSEIGSLVTSHDAEDLDTIHRLESELYLKAEEVAEARRVVEALSRDLAHIAFGNASQYASSPAVERIDRAGVAILAPPDSPQTPLHVDGVRRYAQTWKELDLELAGIVARLLVERVSGLALSTGQNELLVQIFVKGDDILVVRASGKGLTKHAKAFVALGWHKRDDRDYVDRHYESPVTTTRVATDVLALFSGPLGVKTAKAIGWLSFKAA